MPEWGWGGDDAEIMLTGLIRCPVSPGENATGNLGDRHQGQMGDGVSEATGGSTPGRRRRPPSLASSSERQGDQRPAKKTLGSHGRHAGKGEATALPCSSHAIGQGGAGRPEEELRGLRRDSGEEGRARGGGVGRNNDDRLNQDDTGHELGVGRVPERALDDEKRRTKRRRGADRDSGREGESGGAGDASDSLEALLLGGPEPALGDVEASSAMQAQSSKTCAEPPTSQSLSLLTDGLDSVRRMATYSSRCSSVDTTACGHGGTASSRQTASFHRSFSSDCGLPSTVMGSSVSTTPSGAGADSHSTAAPNTGIGSMSPASRSRDPSRVGSPTVVQVGLEGSSRSPSGELRGRSQSPTDECGSVASAVDVSAQNALREELQTMVSLGLLYLKREREFDGEESPHPTRLSASSFVDKDERSEQPRSDALAWLSENDWTHERRSASLPLQGGEDDSAATQAHSDQPLFYGAFCSAAGRVGSQLSLEREPPVTRTSRGDRGSAVQRPRVGQPSPWATDARQPKGTVGRLRAQEAEGEERQSRGGLQTGDDGDQVEARGGEEAGEETETCERRRGIEHGKDGAAAAALGTAEKRLGVHYSRYDRSWVARYTQGGRVLKKYFSTKVYGHELARAKAVAARLEMEQQGQLSAGGAPGPLSAASPGSEKAASHIQDGSGEAPGFASAGLAGPGSQRHVPCVSSAVGASFASAAESQGGALSSSGACVGNVAGTAPGQSSLHPSFAPWLFSVVQAPAASAARSLSPYAFSAPLFCFASPFSGPAGLCSPGAQPVWCTYPPNSCAAAPFQPSAQLSRFFSLERSHAGVPEKPKGSEAAHAVYSEAGAGQAPPATCVTPYGWITFTPFPSFDRNTSCSSREDVKRRGDGEQKSRENADASQRGEGDQSRQRTAEKRASLAAPETGDDQPPAERREDWRPCQRGNGCFSGNAHAPPLASTSVSLASSVQGSVCACKIEPRSDGDGKPELGPSSRPIEELKKSAARQTRSESVGASCDVSPLGFPGPVIGPGCFPPGFPFSPFPSSIASFPVPNVQPSAEIFSPFSPFPLCSSPVAEACQSPVLFGRAASGSSASTERPEASRSPSTYGSVDGGDGAQELERESEREERSGEGEEGRLGEEFEANKEPREGEGKSAGSGAEEEHAPPGGCEQGTQARKEPQGGESEEGRRGNEQRKLDETARRKPTSLSPVADLEGPVPTESHDAGQDAVESRRESTESSEGQDDLERLKTPRASRDGSDKLSEDRSKHLRSGGARPSGCVAGSPPSSLGPHVSPCPALARSPAGFASHLLCHGFPSVFSGVFFPPSPQSIFFPAFVPATHPLSPSCFFPSYSPVSPLGSVASSHSSVPADPTHLPFPPCSPSPRSAA
ncbi:unnamed protein product [Neospora caninum Liverpool]|uniref:AP2 domain transcription factor AP2X-2 n=1 Tax=Neospora caninum (strain Liverpool) TaxID=572307 RepID=F0VM49_NEOCL|nr:uncharacterized protein NCLIV_047580 [Neospora caninum Liverpool]CBZ54327.1 unnamed protein product [Neospora caninum Liverpool]CEL69032.1 TPA: AP2 domain transcription factor AP2X-2 [Neospora caninum Liverpool]|eukprot:XP_003884358.1 uncharacterized protein NCLIV_047580 [Neospora caninum Liverpool]